MSCSQKNLQNYKKIKAAHFQIFETKTEGKESKKETNRNALNKQK